MDHIPFFKKEVEKFQYFQLPQWLFKKPYSDLSNTAKLIYAFLFDRLGFSLKNEWHDKDGKVFIYFTNDEFTEILNCSEKSVIKAKKELAAMLLLKEVRQGMSKPNRIYLLGPKVENELKSSVQELENLQSRTEKNTATELENLQTIKTNNIKTNLSNNNNNVKKDSSVQFSLDIERIISHLNKKAGSSFRSGSAATRKLIKARASEGFTEEDFIAVIDIKCSHWLGNPEFSQYLRPQTLFGPKFESYLNQKIIKNDNVPEWSKPNYKETEMTAEEEANLARIQQEIMDNLAKGGK